MDDAIWAAAADRWCDIEEQIEETIRNLGACGYRRHEVENVLRSTFSNLEFAANWPAG
jgi:hypothetical protein